MLSAVPTEGWSGSSSSSAECHEPVPPSDPNSPSARRSHVFALVSFPPATGHRIPWALGPPSPGLKRGRCPREASLLPSPNTSMSHFCKFTLFPGRGRCWVQGRIHVFVNTLITGNSEPACILHYTRVMKTPRGNRLILSADEEPETHEVGSQPLLCQDKAQTRRHHPDPRLGTPVQFPNPQQGWKVGSYPTHLQAGRPAGGALLPRQAGHQPST